MPPIFPPGGKGGPGGIGTYDMIFPKFDAEQLLFRLFCCKTNLEHTSPYTPPCFPPWGGGEATLKKFKRARAQLDKIPRHLTFHSSKSVHK